MEIKALTNFTHANNEKVEKGQIINVREEDADYLVRILFATKDFEPETETIEEKQEKPKRKTKELKIELEDKAETVIE